MALFSVLCFLPTLALADVATDDRIKLHKDAIVRDVTCGVVTEFAIRDVNLLIAQMGVINPGSKDDGSATKNMVAIREGYKLDLEYHAEELMRLGIDKSEITKMIADASIIVHQRYIQYYMKSFDVDVAKVVIANTIQEQGSCSETFVKEVLPGLKSRKGQVNG